MKIDEIYINEAIRIRQDYINNLLFINKKEELLKDIIKSMGDISKEIKDVDELSEEIYIKKLTELNTVVDDIKREVMPYHDKVVVLDNDQKKLYRAIKDKYPNILDEEIQKQIIPHVVEFDKQLRNILKKENI
jgi:broad-specificity NMP kinase